MRISDHLFCRVFFLWRVRKSRSLSLSYRIQAGKNVVSFSFQLSPIVAQTFWHFWPHCTELIPLFPVCALTLVQAWKLGDLVDLSDPFMSTSNPTNSLSECNENGPVSIVSSVMSSGLDLSLTLFCCLCHTYQVSKSGDSCCSIKVNPRRQWTITTSILFFTALVLYQKQNQVSSTSSLWCAVLHIIPRQSCGAL